MTGIQRLELREEQAAKLGTAIENVETHFPVLDKFTGKYMALAVLAWTAGRIYLPMAKDIAAGQVQRQPIARPSPDAEIQVPAQSASLDLPVGGIVPVADETELAREWLTH